MIITGGTSAKEPTPEENVGVRKNDLNKIGTKLISSRTLLIVIEIRKESINQNFMWFHLVFFCQQNTYLVKITLFLKTLQRLRWAKSLSSRLMKKRKIHYSKQKAILNVSIGLPTLKHLIWARWKIKWVKIRISAGGKWYWKWCS